MFLNNIYFIECVNTFRTFSLKQIKAALFLFSEVVSRQKKFEQVDVPLTLMAYHRKVSTFIKKNKMLSQIGQIWQIKDSI